MIPFALFPRKRHPAALLPAAVLVLASAVAAFGQEAASPPPMVVADAVEAIGAGDVQSFRFRASGSSYERVPATNGDPNDSQGAGFDRRYARVNSYTHEVDLGARRAELEIVRTTDGGESTETLSVDSSDPWEAQLAIWMNPYAFLEEAARRSVSTETVVILGTEYTRVAFDGPSGRMMEGYVTTGDQRLERIRTWIDGPDGEAPVDYMFRFYEEIESGHWFPGLFVRKVDDHLDRVLSVLDVTVVESAGGDPPTSAIP